MSGQHASVNWLDWLCNLIMSNLSSNETNYSLNLHITSYDSLTLLVSRPSLLARPRWPQQCSHWRNTLVSVADKGIDWTVSFPNAGDWQVDKILIMCCVNYLVVLHPSRFLFHRHMWERMTPPHPSPITTMWGALEAWSQISFVALPLKTSMMPACGRILTPVMQKVD